MEGKMKVDVGKAIKIVRVANNLKTIEIAQKTGWSSTYISEIESGNKTLTVEGFKAISKVLNMHPSQLMSVVEKYGELCKEEEDELKRYQKTLISALEILIENQKENNKKGKEDTDAIR